MDDITPTNPTQPQCAHCPDASLLVDIAVIKENVLFLRKQVEGNGKPGLTGRVGDLETWMNQEKGASSFRRWALPIVLSVIFGCISATGMVVGLTHKAAVAPPSVSTVDKVTQTPIEPPVARKHRR